VKLSLVSESKKGFLDAITLAVPSGREIVSISFWDRQESAQDYNSRRYWRS